MNVIEKKIFDAVALPASGSVNSLGIDVWQMSVASIQAVWTGASVAGTLQVQVSNDLVSAPASVVNWSDYTGNSKAVSGPGNVMFLLPDAGYRWVRLQYAASSNTGVIDATLLAKG